MDTSRNLDRLGYNLRLAYLQIQKVFLERMEPFELRPAEYAILAILQDNEYVTQKRLGEALNIAPPNLAVVLDRLEKRGVLQRSRSLEDRRVQVLLLTDTGRELVERVEDIERTLEVEASSALTEAERKTLISLLQKIFLAEEARPEAAESTGGRGRRVRAV